MPRKQRFKPSRKPKPITPNEDAPISRPMSNPQNVENPDVKPGRDDDDSLTEPPLDAPSR